MVSRHESAKISASFHWVLDVLCRSCGLVYCSGCVLCCLWLPLKWYTTSLLWFVGVDHCGKMINLGRKPSIATGSCTSGGSCVCLWVCLRLRVCPWFPMATFEVV